jgi:hypothetical protein
VIEQLFRRDGLNVAGTCLRGMGRRGLVTPPPGGSNPFDLSIDPELVHDRGEALCACVRDERAQLRRLVPAASFHSIEDESGLFAQHSLSLTPP